MFKNEKPLLSIRILVAEDSDDIRLLMVRLLTRQGAIVVGAEHGIDAVEKLKSADDVFDIVFMDLQMPFMNGQEAAPLLRSEGYSGPIIALSGHSAEFAKEQDNAFAFDGYLLKPVSTQDLVDKVLEHCAVKISSTPGVGDG